MSVPFPSHSNPFAIHTVRSHRQGEAETNLRGTTKYLQDCSCFPHFLVQVLKLFKFLSSFENQEFKVPWFSLYSVMEILREQRAKVS